MVGGRPELLEQDKVGKEQVTRTGRGRHALAAVDDFEVDPIGPVREPIATPPREFQIQVRESMVQGGVEIIEPSGGFSDGLGTFGCGVMYQLVGKKAWRSIPFR